MPTRKIVYSAADLPDLSSTKRVCVDVETTSFDDKQMAVEAFQGHRVAGIALSVADGSAWYIPIRNRDPGDRVLAMEPAMAFMRNLFTAMPEREVFGHNFKFDLRFLYQDGLVPTCRVADTMVLGRLVDNTYMRLGLDFLAAANGLGAKTNEEVDAYLRGCGSKDYGRVPARIMGPYAMNDVALTYDLRRVLESKLEPFSQDLWATEKKFTKVLAEIEIDGVQVDVKRLKTEWMESLERIIEINAAIDKIAGWEVDPGKAADKNQLLTKQLGIKPPAFTKTGKPQWTKAVLTNLEIPDSAGPEAKEIGHLFRAHSYLSHFTTTYIEGWVERIDANGVLHPDLKQAGTTTGRLSASDPNTQNIPVEAERFIICPPGHCIVSYDFSQVEYRMFAHYTGDPAICNAYLTDPDADFHQYLADQLGVARQFAKTMNFSFLYGMGKEKLLRSLIGMMAIVDDKDKASTEEKLRNLAYVSGLAMAERAEQYIKTEGGMRAIAEKIYDEYHKKYPSIRAFAKKVSEVATYRKYVKNLYGRKYDFDMSKHVSLDQKRAFGPHRAVNYLIQGSCADLLRTKMVELRDKTYEQYGARCFMTVHDSVYFYVPVHAAPEFYVVAKRILESAPEISVPIRVEGKVSVTNVAADVSIKEVRNAGKGLAISKKDGTKTWLTGGLAVTEADVRAALEAAHTAPEHSFSAAQTSRGYRVGRHGV